MNKKPSRFPVLLLSLGGIAVVVLAIGLFGLQQFFARASHYDDQFEVIAKECEQIKTELATMETKKDELLGLDIKLASVDQNLTDYKYIPTYLQQLQMTAASTGNTVRSIRPRDMEKLDQDSPLIKASLAKREALQPASAKDAKKTTRPSKDEKDQETDAQYRYQIQQITLEIEGNYVSLMRFLSALRTFPKLVYVHSLSVTPGRDESDTLTARMETYAIIIPEQYRSSKTTAAVKSKGGKP